MKKLIVILLFLSLFACHRTQYAWVKTDAPNDQQQFYKDQYECNKEAQNLGLDSMFQGWLMRYMTIQQNFEYCMQARGYIWAPMKR